ncbi:MAG: hypothetical protein K2Y30_06910 [Flavobacteriaceae bacterium]|uniref:Uncharacterized protein n=1 Tax=Flavobacterium kayseriense TaxID=2764714 RepID=A0ABR7J6F8_9FLAO|nr:hypothetical protein [Flavobacterium kayseriense]MBC5841105.1 hypothetical protein [Flavobacterium kayseriense]MBC5847633.1 hypothetical protein [Flavobacterium kayseriense]MBX9887648.1 hypothetical protein [Flavobacteriaceae bacterium]
MNIILQNKTANYADQEKQNLQIDYLKNLLSKIENDNLIIEPALQTTIESVINEMPIKTNEKKLDYKSQHLNKISNLKTAVKQKFNLVKKKHYTRQYLALGISMGLCFGLPFAVAIGNIALGPALGIPIGLATGLLIGSRFDKKAISEKRVL